MKSMQKGKECNFHQPGGTGENNTKEVASRSNTLVAGQDIAALANVEGG